MEFLKRFKEKLAYDLSKIELSNKHKRNSFSGDILYISAIEKLIDIPTEIVYLTKNGFIIHLINCFDDKYIKNITEPKFLIIYNRVIHYIRFLFVLRLVHL